MAKGPKRYEGSKADMATDRKMAKAKGMTIKAWENSKADARMDKAAEAKMKAKKRKSGR